MTFVTLPVADVTQARAFWTGVGLPLAERFCDGEALCVLVSDRLAVMLVDRLRFTGLVPGLVVEPHTASEVVIGLAAGSRHEVDELTERAVALGGTALRTSGVGAMYGRSFTDPDGHVWEILHLTG